MLSAQVANSSECEAVLALGTDPTLQGDEFISRIGERLIGAHLLLGLGPREGLAEWAGDLPAVVERVRYEEGDIWLDPERSAGFIGVPDEVWHFELGGYPVCGKWLNERRRKGGKSPRAAQPLRAADVEHFRTVATAIVELMELAAVVDDAIEASGGWPDAFAN